ncbi:MAG: hypothetical protein ACHREM_19895 [Polyangiales bacterium]
MTSRLSLASALMLCLTACARVSCGRTESTPLPVPAIARFAREPLAAVTVLDERRFAHALRVDERGSILPWSTHEAPFHEIVTRGFDAFATIPAMDDGRPPYFISAMFEGASFAPAGWLQNPPGLAAMMVRSAIRYRAYGGDERPLARARAFVDNVLLHGRTEVTDAWSSVPYASANGGEADYRGGEDTIYCREKDACGRGDGRGFLEPDKIGELGQALVTLYEATGEASYLATAIHFADELARHVTPGDATHSPWPFRVDAKTATVVREAYGTNVVFAIALFDELARLGRSTSAHREARAVTWKWLVDNPLETNLWQGYFEDIPIHLSPGLNPNQYSAGETARYLLTHPEIDPASKAHVESILRWIGLTFTVDVVRDDLVDRGHDHGAEVLSEQGADMAKMGSHTARFASLLAMLYEQTGEPSLRARAFRSFAWASYCLDDSGLIQVSPDAREGYWFSDSYVDYLPHFLDGIAAVPAWAPRHESHLLRSSSVVTKATFSAGGVDYSTFDAEGAEDLRLARRPAHIEVGGVELRDVETRSLDDGSVWMMLRRRGARDVHITF